MSDIAAAIDSGLAYIAGQQLPDGGFESWSSPQGKFKPVYRYRTTFVPSLVLASLASSGSPSALRIRRKLADFIRAQQSASGSFNYWAVDVPERQQFPYPDDLDDTFCALIGLALHDAELIDGKTLAAAVKLLIANETKPGGPYRTWLQPPPGKIWKDVDMVVNSNIAYFLSLVSEPLPELDAFLAAALQGRLSSPYYPGNAAPLYFLARVSRDDKVRRLADRAKRKLGRTQSPLEIALMLSVLSRVPARRHIREGVERLLAAQRHDGSWPAAAFCLDPHRGGTAYYHGAAVLTTAFAIEALQQCSQTVTKIQPQPDIIHKPAAPRLLKLAQADCRQLSGELRQKTLASLRRVINGTNGPEIIGLPYKFIASLKTQLQLSDNLVDWLSLANAYGWLAYTIYDDFLDEEGKPALLPVANAAHRRSLYAFRQALPGRTDFETFMLKTFDVIDSANAWEISHCRLTVDNQTLYINHLPDYGRRMKMAERSLGHGLTPAAILIAAGYRVDSVPFQAIQLAMKHYLIARQLSDDAHDWEEDLGRGHITYVVASILESMNVKQGSHDLKELKPVMKQHFWKQTIYEVSEQICHHAKASRRAVRRSGVLSSENIITLLAGKLEQTARDTQQTARRSQDFLNHYRTYQSDK